MIESVELYHPNLIITPNKNLLLENLNQQNVSFIEHKNSIIFNAIPFLGFIPSIIIVAYKEDLITKMHIKTDLNHVKTDEHDIYQQKLAKVLVEICGAPSLSYEDHKLKQHIDAWYHHHLFLKTTYNKDKHEIITDFILTHLKHKRNLFKPVFIYRLSLISVLFSILIALLIGLVAGFKFVTPLLFLVITISTLLCLFLFTTLYLTFKKPLLPLSNPIKQLLIGYKKTMIHVPHIEYRGLISKHDASPSNPGFLIITKDLIYLIHKISKKVVSETIDYDLITDISFFKDTLTITHTNDMKYHFRIENLKDANALMHDLNGHKSKRDA